MHSKHFFIAVACLYFFALTGYVQPPAPKTHSSSLWNLWEIDLPNTHRSHGILLDLEVIWCYEHRMIALGKEVPLFLTLASWNKTGFANHYRRDSFQLIFDYPEDKIKIYCAGKLCASGEIQFPKDYNPSGDPNVIFMVEAIDVGEKFDDIDITVTGIPSYQNETEQNSSSSGIEYIHKPCAAKISFTVYDIDIEFMEKPWGGGWSSPEGGMLWSVNEIAIRAVVKPKELAEKVKDTTFSYSVGDQEISLLVEDFAADEQAPSIETPPWKKYPSNPGNHSIAATIHFEKQQNAPPDAENDDETD